MIFLNIYFSRFDHFAIQKNFKILENFWIFKTTYRNLLLILNQLIVIKRIHTLRFGQSFLEAWNIFSKVLKIFKENKALMPAHFDCHLIDEIVADGRNLDIERILKDTRRQGRIQVTSIKSSLVAMVAWFFVVNVDSMFDLKFF